VTQLEAKRRIGRSWTGLATAHAVVGAFAVALCFVPLFDLLGFEFAAAIGWCLAYVSGWRACASGTRARTAAPAPFPGEALLRTAVENLTLAATPLAIIALHALRVPTCNWSAGLAFYALFPLPAIAYGTALGFGLGLALPVRRARAAFVLWSLVTYAWAIGRLLTEPPKFAFNAFVGYFPGPIYDSEVAIGRSLLAARGVVLCEAALFALLAALGWEGKRWRWREIGHRWRGERALLGGFAIAIAGVLTLAVFFAAPLGLSIDREFIQRTLGGRVETAHCTVFYDRSTTPAARARRLADEHEARWIQLAAWFGVEPGRKIRSYVYASAEQKKRLMGAAGTSFEDALHDEFHINASSEDPHPVLTHEMAHIFAAQIDPWVPVCWKIGIHEGIAVAAEWDEECVRLEMTPHQACAAMDSLGLLPDLERSLSAIGFWTLPEARAYTACGSFVRFLVDTRGLERFKVLWRRGDFERAYGTSLVALLDEWKAMLARTTVGPAEMRRAERLFRPPAIFAVACAHEQARLEARAAQALGSGDATTAAALYERLGEIDARNPERALALARARLRAGDPVAAAEAALAVVDAAGGGASGVSAERAWRLLGDAGWVAEASGARVLGAPPESCFARAARLASSSADARASEVALAVLADPRLRNVLGDYLADRGLPDAAGLARLVSARLAAPESGLPRYLLGRRLFFAGEFLAAAAEMDAALATQDLGPQARWAALELRAQAWFRVGRVEVTQRFFEELSREATPEWRSRGISDWVRRCRLEPQGQPGT